MRCSLIIFVYFSLVGVRDAKVSDVDLIVVGVENIWLRGRRQSHPSHFIFFSCRVPVVEYFYVVALLIAVNYATAGNQESYDAADNCNNNNDRRFFFIIFYSLLGHFWVRSIVFLVKVSSRGCIINAFSFARVRFLLSIRLVSTGLIIGLTISTGLRFTAWSLTLLLTIWVTLRRRRGGAAWAILLFWYRHPILKAQLRVRIWVRVRHNEYAFASSGPVSWANWRLPVGANHRSRGLVPIISFINIHIHLRRFCELEVKALWTIYGAVGLHDVVTCIVLSYILTTFTVAHLRTRHVLFIFSGYQLWLLLSLGHPTFWKG